LYPDYICDVTMVPCNKLGIKVRFYKVKENLEPDFESAQRLLTKNTKAFLAVHYFGFPNVIGRIREFCDTNGLFFVEDCAHSFLTNVRNNTVGSFGDISVYSFRKMIPLLNGAALVVNAGRDASSEVSFPHGNNELAREDFSFRKKLKVLAKRYSRKYSFPIEKFQRFSETMAQAGATENEEMPFRMDDSSLMALKNCRWDQEINRRRKNYRFWVEQLPDDFRVVFSRLNQGVVPMAVPFYVAKRNMWHLKYIRKKIGVTIWPNLPVEVTGMPDQNAVRIQEKLILFPL